MKDLKIAERRIEDVVVLDLTGQIKIGENTLKLRNVLREYVQSGEKKVLLNLDGITHIDSSGLGDLVSGFVSFENKGGFLKLLNLTEHVSELMMITKLLTVFETFTNEEEAIRSFKTAVPDKAASTTAV